MSDKTTEKAEKTEKTTTAAKDKKETRGKVGDVVKGKAEAKRTEKIVWTLDRCKKYARRYTTEAVWASAAPASYKSAVAHGWLTQCLAEMTRAQTGAKVLPGSFKKDAPTPPSKKAA